MTKHRYSEVARPGGAGTFLCRDENAFVALMCSELDVRHVIAALEEEYVAGCTAADAFHVSFDGGGMHTLPATSPRKVAP